MLDPAVTSSRPTVGSVPQYWGDEKARSRRPRVMFVIDGLGVGGAERQFIELVEGLNQREYDPLMVCLSGRVETSKAPLGVPMMFLERRTKRDLHLVWRLASLMRSKEIQVVQSYLWLANFYARAAAFLSRVPVVVSSVRGLDYSISSWQGRLRWSVDRLLDLTSSATTVNSREMRDYLVGTGFDAAKLRVIHNGIAASRFVADLTVKEAKQQLGLDPRLAAVGICARLVPFKDHRTFLLAAKEVLSVLPDTRFLIVGDGPLRDDLESFAQEIGVGSRVLFIGMVTQDIAKVIVAFDVSVLCSKHEGSPNAILESMAMGKPVVATAVGGCPELVTDGETGILVPKEDPALLAAGIIRLLREKELAERMGERGRKRAMEEFEVGRMVRAYESLYAELLKQRGLL